MRGVWVGIQSLAPCEFTLEFYPYAKVTFRRCKEAVRHLSELTCFYQVVALKNTEEQRLGVRNNAKVTGQ